ncbi:MAG: hypothetical protein IPP74_08055 [Alphaproteobacteria bacterium]|nr:hypothetical protein [Alphaproteobacteria bacterium]
MATRLILDTSLSLTWLDDYNIYNRVNPEIKEILEESFPALQWNIKVADQLKAAQEIYPTIRQMLLGLRQSNAQGEGVFLNNDCKMLVVEILANSVGSSNKQASNMIYFAIDQNNGIGM